MKRIWVTAATFAITAAIAGWLALTPVAPSGAMAPVTWFNEAAQFAIDGIGQGNAVLAAIALCLVLTFLVAVTFGTRPPTALTGPTASPDEDAQTAPAARQGELFSLSAQAPPPVTAIDEDSDGVLVRTEPAPSETAPPEPTSPELAFSEATLPASPVLLVRRPRERGRDWFEDASWLGGLPRLGPMPWPRDTNGTPLPFAAQIDMAELVAASPGNPLPHDGSLAFFLGAGAVVAVPPGDHHFTPPPPGLPPAFDEGGFPFPPGASALSKPLFPFWPVEMATLDLSSPNGARAHSDSALGTYLTENFGKYPRATFRATEKPDAARTQEPAIEHPQDVAIWWHAVRNLAIRLDVAAAVAPRQLARREARLTAALDTLDTMHREHRGSLEIDRGEDMVATARADLDRFTAQLDALPQMAAAMARLVDDRDDWTALDPEEVALVGDILTELHTGYADVVATQIPASLTQLSTLSLRTMASGDDAALAALPEDQLLRINTEYALANRHQHQIFGASETPQSAILLLQLGYDDMIEWRWPEMGAWRFEIAADALAARRWNEATLGFETA